MPDEVVLENKEKLFRSCMELLAANQNEVQITRIDHLAPPILESAFIASTPWVRTRWRNPGYMTKAKANAAAAAYPQVCGHELSARRPTSFAKGTSKVPTRRTINLIGMTIANRTLSNSIRQEASQIISLSSPKWSDSDKLIHICLIISFLHR